MPEMICGDSHLKEISIDAAAQSYVMSNPSLEQLLFDRNIVGLEFAGLCQRASEAFLRHFANELKALYGDIAELIVLSKGIYYWMHNAYAAVMSENLEANLIATKRISVSGTTVKIDVPYCDFSAPASNLILADTIASGATVVAALEKYKEFHNVQRIFVFSIAGSCIGGRHIAAFCRSNHIACTLVYSLAAFGLAENGFDLSFLHPETICPNQDYLIRAERLFDGKPVSAVGWDFGSQAQSIKKYKMLCKIESDYWGLEDSTAFRQKADHIDPSLVSKERAAYKDRIVITNE